MGDLAPMPCRVLCENHDSYDFPDCWSADLLSEGELRIMRRDGGTLAVFARGDWRRVIPIPSAA